MELSKTQLMLNYEKTMRQAEALEFLAEQMLSLSDSEIEGNMETLGNIWKGESGSLYVKKGKRLNKMIHQHAKSLQQSAAILKKSAKNTYYAELRCIEIAEAFI